jgi:hypothetical protein
MVDDKEDGGEDDPKTGLDLKCFRCIRGFLKKIK